MLPQDFFSDHVQNFIRSVENEEPETIVLRNKTIGGLSSSFIADQVSGRQKAKEKIPLYYQTPFIVFPPKVNLEQSSSEATARYKVGQVRTSGLTSFSRCADLTGGFGIDSYFFSTLFASVIYVEPDHELFDIASHNHKQLKATNIGHIPASASDFLSSSSQVFDLVYIDPSRRLKGNQKVHSFAQSEPNVVELLSSIFERTTMLMVKASPLLDLQLAIAELRSVKRIAVIAVNNDCKELLFVVEKDNSSHPLIHTVNIRNGGMDTFDFSLHEEQSAVVSFSDPRQYLFEPNAAIMKAGAFKSIASAYKLFKVQASTHLYTSDDPVSNFPGRIFKVIAHVKPDPRQLSPFFPDGKANIVTRNYPLSVDELRKKTKLADGGDRFLIAFSGQSQKFTVAAERIR